MSRYENYKDTDVEWIGEIPEHWEVKKLSHGFNKIGSGTTPTTGNLEYYQDGTFSWLQTGDLNDGEIYSTSRKVTQIALDDFSSLKFYGVDSLVIAMYGATIGKTGILKIEAVTNQACCVLSEPKSFISKYVFYWFIANKNTIISLSYGGGQPNISQETIRSIRIPCPLPQEQTAIINYLDAKTEQIDRLISNKRKLIELLKEERTAIINEAVSGEGKNWERKKLKYVANKVQTGSTPPSNEVKYYFEEVSWFTPSDFSKNLLLTKSKRKLSKSAISDGVVKIIPANSVLFVGIGATLGKVGYIISSATSNQQINSIQLSSKNEAIFYAYYFYVNQLNIARLANAATLPILNQSQMKDILLPIPNSKEELNDVLYLIQNENMRIDDIIFNIQTEISLMEEYKTSLISEVVTGKQKVI